MRDHILILLYLLESNWGSVSKLNCDQVLEFLSFFNVSRCASISWIYILESGSVNNVFKALVVNIESQHWYSKFVFHSNSHHVLTQTIVWMDTWTATGSLAVLMINCHLIIVQRLKFASWFCVDLAKIIANQSELVQYIWNEILCTHTIYTELFWILMHGGWGSLNGNWTEVIYQLFYLFPSIIDIFFSNTINSSTKVAMVKKGSCKMALQASKTFIYTYCRSSKDFFWRHR